MARGGIRPGAGRKKKSDTAVKAIGAAAAAVRSAPSTSRRFATALDYLMDVINDATADTKERLQAAQVAVPYTNAKLTDAAPKRPSGADAQQPPEDDMYAPRKVKGFSVVDGGK